MRDPTHDKNSYSSNDQFITDCKFLLPTIAAAIILAGDAPSASSQADIWLGNSKSDTVNARADSLALSKSILQHQMVEETRAELLNLMYENFPLFIRRCFLCVLLYCNLNRASNSIESMTQGRKRQLLAAKSKLPKFHRLLDAICNGTDSDLVVDLHRFKEMISSCSSTTTVVRSNTTTGTKRKNQSARDAILDLLAHRDQGKTICPSEAARRIGGDDAFRDYMDVIRDAARDLVADEMVEVTQRREVVDIDKARGPIRLRMKT